MDRAAALEAGIAVVLEDLLSTDTLVQLAGGIRDAVAQVPVLALLRDLVGLLAICSADKEVVALKTHGLARGIHELGSAEGLDHGMLSGPLGVGGPAAIDEQRAEQQGSENESIHLQVQSS